MNKQELTNHLKQSPENIDAILKVAELPVDLPDYSPEQIKVVEEINHLVENKQAKTYKEASTLYRKGQNEHQLNEIALRHGIAAERIPEILAAMKLKIEALTEAQFELFREVCQSLQSGVELPLAAQTSLDKAKVAKGKKLPEFASQQSAIALTNGRNGSAIAEASAPGNGDTFGLDILPDTAVKDLRELASDEFSQKHDSFIAGAANGILDVMDGLTSETAHQVGVNIGREAVANGMAAAAHTGATRKIIEEVKRQRRPK